jgi:UPF0716 protein FxsA
MSPRRRGRIGWVLVVLFVVLPLVELYFLIQVGQVIGAWWTIALLVADSILGAWLVKREGRRAWAALREALASGRMPHRELADGALVLIGGTLLMTPGFVSDVLGVALVLPLTRPLFRRVLARVVAARLVTGVGGPGPRFGPGSGSGPGSAPGAWPGTGSRPGPVVRGDVVDPD